MLPWYIGALVLGGVLIGASIVLGGDHGDSDADVDHDIDHDIDADVDADADVEVEGVDKDLELGKGIGDGAWLPFLSLRFWTFAFGSFGLTGLLLNLIAGLPLGIELGISIFTGLAIGWTAAWAFRRLKESNVTGRTALSHLQGAEAQVLLPIGPGKTGKIRALVDGQSVDLMARTSDGRLLERRETVLVVSVQDGIAEVTGLRRLPTDPPAQPERPLQTPNKEQAS